MRGYIPDYNSYNFVHINEHYCTKIVRSAGDDKKIVPKGGLRKMRARADSVRAG